MNMRERFPYLPFEPDPWHDTDDFLMGVELGIWWGQMCSPFDTFTDVVTHVNKYKVIEMAKRPEVQRTLLAEKRASRDFEQLTFGPKVTDLEKGEDSDSV